MLTLAILNYNGNDTLAESIDSVLRQTRKPDRFVVIDNSSTDGSRQIAVDKGIEVKDADNKFKFITGLNSAIATNVSLLFFMQNDVILDDTCLESMMKNKPEKGPFILQPVIYDTKGNIDNSGMDYKWPGYGERRKKKWWDENAKYEKCGLVTTICFLTDNNWMEYDQRFAPAYYEDLDFYLKGIFEHYLIPSASCVHKGNHTFSQTYKKKEISEICRRNRKKLIRKYYKGFDRWLRLAVTSVADIVKKTIDIIGPRWIP